MKPKNSAMENIESVNLRQCSFNPEKYLIEIESMRGDGTLQKYLEVKYRVLWFLTYCKENAIEGFIDEADIVYIPEARIFQATANVIMNDKIVGKGVAGKPYVYGDDACSATVIQDIATAAKGRALANAGFGTAMCAFEDNEPGPCEAGIRPTIGFDENPLIPDDYPKQTESLPKITKPLTLEAAQRIVIQMGEHSGKTLGEIMAIDPQYIKFLAYKYNPRKHPEYQEGARVILQKIA